MIDLASLEVAAVNTAILHSSAHIVDLVSAAMIVDYHGDRCQVGEKFTVASCSDRRFLSDEETLLRLKRGVLDIGYGGGPFDDHREGCEGRCTSDLVAEFLGLSERPEWQRILGSIREADLRGRKPFLSWPDLVAAMTTEYPVSQLLICTRMILRALMNREIRLVEARERVSREASYVVVPCSTGVRTVVVISNATSDQEARAARELLDRDFDLDLLLVRKANGHTLFLGDKSYTQEETIRALARIVRVMEQRKVSGRPTLTDWKTLSANGTAAEVQEWYVDAYARWVLNGSESAPKVKPTHLTLEEAIKAATLALADGKPEGCEEPCLRGRCQFYAFGLPPCFRARKDFERRQKRDNTPI